MKEDNMYIILGEDDSGNLVCWTGRAGPRFSPTAWISDEEPTHFIKDAFLVSETYGKFRVDMFNLWSDVHKIRFWLEKL